MDRLHVGEGVAAHSCRVTGGERFCGGYTAGRRESFSDSHLLIAAQH